MELKITIFFSSEIALEIKKTESFKFLAPFIAPVMYLPCFVKVLEENDSELLGLKLQSFVSVCETN